MAEMIIGLTGKRLSGKDTAGAYLVEHYGFERVAFADKLKEGVAALFDITREEVDEYKGQENDGIPYAEVILQVGSNEYSWTWVEFLQRFGTDMGRKVWGWDFWVNLAFVDPVEFYHAREHYDDRNIVVTDVRFDNEAERIIKLGGTIIRLIRPVVDEAHDKHESEDGISDHFVEYDLHNDGNLDELYGDLLLRSL